MQKNKKEKRVWGKVGFIYICVCLSMFFGYVIHAQATSTATTSPVLFVSDLKLGSTSDEVMRLQQFLNTHDFPLADIGVGSYGQETSYFGQLTKNALIQFQQYFAQDILTPLGLTSGTGNFYTSTRTFVNTILLSEKNSPSESNKQIIKRKGGGRSGGSSSASLYTISVSGSDTISISPTGEQTVSKGATQSFTVTADDGYTVSSSVTGTCPAGSWSDSVYTTGAITSSCSVIFSSEINTYAVTLSGDITPVGEQNVLHGASQMFTVDAGSGYGIGTTGGTCPAGSWVHATYSTGPIIEPCSLSFSPATIGVSIGSSIATSQDIYLRQNGSNFEYLIPGLDWDSSLFPTITNIGGDVITVHLVGDFTITSANSYIIIDSDNITIQGETGKEGPTVITVDGVTDYPGFIRNGSNSTSGFNNITISNVFVNAVDSTLAQNGGWLAQEYFGVGATNNEINSCGSNGDISEHGGGIVGARSSNVTISDCFSTGMIKINAGGIVGTLADTVTVRNSYSSGLISVAAGGIFGGAAIDSVAQNTYSTGLINGDAGGIFGELHDNPTVLNSYTSGSAVGGGKGILAGSSLDGAGNYSESNNSGFGWNDTNVASVLTGIDTVWKSIGVNQPYRLLSFDASPYDDSTQTISAGESSTPVFGYYNSCSIVSISGGDTDSYSNITIDTDTGIISTTNTVEGGVYDVLVSCDTLHGTYTLSTLELTVN